MLFGLLMASTGLCLHVVPNSLDDKGAIAMAYKGGIFYNKLNDNRVPGRHGQTGNGGTLGRLAQLSSQNSMPKQQLLDRLATVWPALSCLAMCGHSPLQSIHCQTGNCARQPQLFCRHSPPWVGRGSWPFVDQELPLSPFGSGGTWRRASEEGH